MGILAVLCSTLKEEENPILRWSDQNNDLNIKDTKMLAQDFMSVESALG